MKRKKKRTLEAIRLLHEVARLYYEYGQTQERIAQQMGFSRPKVQQLLNTARRMGVVQIRVVDPVTPPREIEEELKERFQLSRAIIVSGSIGAESIVRKNIGRAAGIYLEHILRDNDVVGVGWGRTVYETVDCFNPSGNTFIKVVPLTGGVGTIPASLQANQLAAKLAEKTGGNFFPFYAPALVDDERIVQAFYCDHNLKKVAKLWKNVTVVLMGIGQPLSIYRNTAVLYYSDADVALLEKHGEIGDILGHFLCHDGELCDASFDRKVIGMSLEQLKKVKQVIGVAGALEKKDVILAVLRKKYVNVLITDGDVAQEILKEGKHEVDPKIRTV